MIWKKIDKRIIALSIVATLLAGFAAGAVISQGLWYPDVMIVERSQYEVYPPRWDLTVYPGGYEHEFLTEEELAKFMGFYCGGVGQPKAWSE